jgi:hypothetical protein
MIREAWFHACSILYGAGFLAFVAAACALFVWVIGDRLGDVVIASVVLAVCWLVGSLVRPDWRLPWGRE